MKRILLFLATNLAVVVVLGLVASLLGVNRFLTAHVSIGIIRSCRQIGESGNHQASQEVMGNALEIVRPLKQGHILRQIILVDAAEGP